MKIDELISELEQVKKEHGNLELKFKPVIILIKGSKKETLTVF
jgi:hypothetical protein